MQRWGQKIWPFMLFITASSCSLRSSTGVKKLTERFIEIEAPTDKVWFGCFEINPEEHLSLMNFYVKDDSTTYQFLYRKLIETKQCKTDLKNYERLLRGAHRITIVGNTAKYELEETNERIEGVPEEFAIGHKKFASWIFIRLQSENGCEAYFEEDCKPENYWGGLVPQE